MRLDKLKNALNCSDDEHPYMKMKKHVSKASPGVFEWGKAPGDDLTVRLQEYVVLSPPSPFGAVLRAVRGCARASAARAHAVPSVAPPVPAHEHPPNPAPPHSYAKLQNAATATEGEQEPIFTLSDGSVHSLRGLAGMPTAALHALLVSNKLEPQVPILFVEPKGIIDYRCVRARSPLLLCSVGHQLRNGRAPTMAAALRVCMGLASCQLSAALQQPALLQTEVAVVIVASPGGTPTRRCGTC